MDSRETTPHACRRRVKYFLGGVYLVQSPIWPTQWYAGMDQQVCRTPQWGDLAARLYLYAVVSRVHCEDGLHTVSAVQTQFHQSGPAAREAELHSVKLFGCDRRERHSG